MASIVKWTLDANTGPFSAGMDKAAKKAGVVETQMSKAFGPKQAKEIIKFAKGFAAITGAVVVAGVAIKAFADSVVNARLQMKKFEDQSGLTGNQMRQLKLEAGLAGAELEALIPKNLSERQLDALMNQTSEQARLFRFLGVEVVDAAGKLRDTGDVFLEILSAAKSAEDPVASMGAAIKLLGGVSEEALAALDASAIDRISEAAHTFGTQTGPEAIKAAEDWTRAMTGAETLAIRLGNALANMGIPTATEFVQSMVLGLSGFGTAFRLTAEGAKLFGRVMLEVFTTVTSFGTKSFDTMVANLNRIESEFFATSKAIIDRTAKFNEDVTGNVRSTGKTFEDLAIFIGEGKGPILDTGKAITDFVTKAKDLTAEEKAAIALQRKVNDGWRERFQILSALTPQMKEFNAEQKEGNAAAEENLKSQSALSTSIVAEGDNAAEAFARQQETKREALQETMDMAREDFEQGFIDREELRSVLESDTEARKQLIQNEADFAKAAAMDVQRARLQAFTTATAAAVSSAKSIFSTIASVQTKEAKASQDKLAMLEAEAVAEKEKTGTVSDETARRLRLARTEFDNKTDAMRKGAIANKIAAVSEILVQNALSIARTAAATPFPFNAAFIATAIATGIATLGQATAVSLAPLPKLHDGGFAADEFAASLQRGEAVLSQRGVAALGTDVIDAANEGRTIPAPPLSVPRGNLGTPFDAGPGGGGFDGRDIEGIVNNALSDALANLLGTNNIASQNLAPSLVD